MAAHETISTSIGIGHPTGEEALHLVASIKGYPGWEVAADVVLTVGGTAALGMLRIRPRGYPEDEDVPTAQDVPAGGIPARLVRAINAGELLDLAQADARTWPRLEGPAPTPS